MDSWWCRVSHYKSWINIKFILTCLEHGERGLVGVQNCLLWSPCQSVCCFIIFHPPLALPPSLSASRLLAKVKSVCGNNGAGDCSNPRSPYSPLSALAVPSTAFSSRLPSLMLAYKLAHVSLALRIITLKLATWDSRVQFETTNGQADALPDERGEHWGGEDLCSIRPLWCLRDAAPMATPTTLGYSTCLAENLTKSNCCHFYAFHLIWRASLECARATCGTLIRVYQNGPL